MRLALFVTTILLLALALAATAGAQSTETIGIIAMDADITGNAATSLGPLNACTRAEPGESVTLDLVVDAVPASRPFIAYQIDIEYDANLLTLTATDSEFLLGANGVFEPFEGLSEPVPDSDGRFTLVVADLSQLEDAESGAGVLTRLTFSTKGSGVGNVAPVFNPPDFYPALIDVQNTTIGVDSIGAASVAVGQDCPVPIEATPVVTELPAIDQIPEFQTPPPIATPSPSPEGQTPAPGDGSGSVTPQPTGTGTAGNGVGITDVDEGDGDGATAGTIIAVAGLAVAGLGLVIGGFALLRRRPSRGTGGTT